MCVVWLFFNCVCLCMCVFLEVCVFSLVVFLKCVCFLWLFSKRARAEIICDGTRTGGCNQQQSSRLSKLPQIRHKKNMQKSQETPKPLKITKNLVTAISSNQAGCQSEEDQPPAFFVFILCFFVRVAVGKIHWCKKSCQDNLQRAPVRFAQNQDWPKVKTGF